jgi:hypothetical protein
MNQGGCGASIPVKQGISCPKTGNLVNIKPVKARQQDFGRLPNDLDPPIAHYTLPPDSAPGYVGMVAVAGSALDTPRVWG